MNIGSNLDAFLFGQNTCVQSIREKNNVRVLLTFFSSIISEYYDENKIQIISLMHLVPKFFRQKMAQD